jgi:hypothetical protein
MQYPYPHRTSRQRGSSVVIMKAAENAAIEFHAGMLQGKWGKLP